MWPLCHLPKKKKKLNVPLKGILNEACGAQSCFN